MNFLPGEMAPGGTRRAAPRRRAPSRSRARREWRGRTRFALTGELALIEPAGPLHYLDVDVGGQMVKATCADPDGLCSGRRDDARRRPVQAVHLFDRDERSARRRLTTSKKDPWLSISFSATAASSIPRRISTASPTSPSPAARSRRSASGSMPGGAEVRDVSGRIVTPGPDRPAHACLLGRHLARHRRRGFRAAQRGDDLRRHRQRRARQFRRLPQARHRAQRGAHPALPARVVRRHLRLLQPHHGGRGPRHAPARRARLPRGGRGQPRPHRRHQGAASAATPAARPASCRSTSPSRSPTRPACR